MRLNNSELMRRVSLSQTEAHQEHLTSHPFIEVDLKTTMPSAEYIIEMEDGNGSKMKMHIKGNTGIDSLGLIRTFWKKGL